MSESARNQISDAQVTISNEEAYKKRLEDAWAMVDKQNKEIIGLKAKIEILKEVISESVGRGY